MSLGEVTPAADGAGLFWGIKRSFLQYIARMPDGDCSVTDGADPDVDARFRFAVDRISPVVDHEWTVLCRGDVRFAGHHGMLFVQIADPMLTIRGTSGHLSVVDGPAVREGVRDARRTLASFDVVSDPDHADDIVTATGVRLVAEGAEIFNDVYPAGELFDDFRVHAAPFLPPDAHLPRSS